MPNETGAEIKIRNSKVSNQPEAMPDREINRIISQLIDRVSQAVNLHSKITNLEYRLTAGIGEELDQYLTNPPIIDGHFPQVQQLLSQLIRVQNEIEVVIDRLGEQV